MTGAGPVWHDIMRYLHSEDASRQPVRPAALSERAITFENNLIKVSNDGKRNSNIKFKTGLSNLENRLRLLNIGELHFLIENENMTFCIILKDKK